MHLRVVIFLNRKRLIVRVILVGWEPWVGNKDRLKVKTSITNEDQSVHALQLW